jgi:hypothetical protein
LNIYIIIAINISIIVYFIINYYLCYATYNITILVLWHIDYSVMYFEVN